MEGKIQKLSRKNGSQRDFVRIVILIIFGQFLDALLQLIVPVIRLEAQSLKDKDRGSYSHFLDHKRPNQTPGVNLGRPVIICFFFYFLGVLSDTLNTFNFHLIEIRLFYENMGTGF